MTVHVCEACGAEFQAYRSQRRRYCCHTCYAASRRGPANVKYNGGLSNLGARTIIINRDGTSTLYYRALMEAHLGRELRPGEIVHHINGDPSDDRIENLQVLTQCEHIKIHRHDLLAGRSARSTRDRIAKAAA